VAETDWLLDTSILVDVLRGYTEARDWIDSIAEAHRFTSVITAAELIAGCRNRAEQRKIERELQVYTPVWLDQDISQEALDLYRRFYLSHGIGFHDCLIAATAIRRKYRVATLNLKHFKIFSNIKANRPY